MTDLDEPDYDPVAHLNAMFSVRSDLGRLSELRDHISLVETNLEYELSNPVELTQDDTEAASRVDRSPQELSKLLGQMDVLKNRATETEQRITKMTADIKRLDSTKSNLVKSITVLRRLQMLTNAYDQLTSLVHNRQYKEMAQTLPAVTELMSHFKSFRSISQIATLSKQIAEIQNTISDQIFKDFSKVIESRAEAGKRDLGLADACKVLDSLTGNQREQLIQWYCNVQLKEYRTIFKHNDEAGSLENISRRYGHMKRLIKRHDDELGQFFAPDWPVEEELCRSFCNTTRDDIGELLKASKQSGRNIDVQLLLNALEETLAFEVFLNKRFKGKFDQAISSAFQPHLKVWIEYQDKVLTTKFQQFRAPPQPKSGEDEEAEPSVLPSSADLFVFYKQVLAQTAKLSTGPPLADLARLFGKWLTIYSNQVLKSIIPPKVSTIDDIKSVCLALNTADYCRTTTDQLEQRIIGQLDEDQKDHVNLESQKDSFSQVISSSIGMLVQKVESACDYSWREMVNTNWAKLEADGVGDRSGYVSELRRVIEEESGKVLEHVHKDLHARLLCDKIVDVISIVFLQKVVQCKPVSEVAAEQMLLDVYELKNCFLGMPKLRPKFEVGSTFQRHVNQSLLRVETVLKVILTQPEPAQGLVQNYLYCVKDRSVDNFSKILQLKGIHRSDAGRYIELFNANLKAHDGLLPEWSVLSNLNMHEQTHSRTPSAQGMHSISHTPSLFDNKVLGGLTREGFVERLGHEQTNRLNELKRLFKRDRDSGGGGGGGGDSGGTTSPVGRYA